MLILIYSSNLHRAIRPKLPNGTRRTITSAKIASRSALVPRAATEIATGNFDWRKEETPCFRRCRVGLVAGRRLIPSEERVLGLSIPSLVVGPTCLTKIFPLHNDTAKMCISAADPWFDLFFIFFGVPSPSLFLILGCWPCSSYAFLSKKLLVSTSSVLEHHCYAWFRAQGR